MKILVLSDTHGDLTRVYAVLKKIRSEIDGIIHLGDVVPDMQQIIIDNPALKHWHIRGNCDSAMVPSEEIIEIEDKKIFITHGHIYNVNSSYTTIYYKALQVGAAACLFGHTHIPLLDRGEDLILLNPGSISRPRGGNPPSYGILNIEKGKEIEAAVVGIYPLGNKILF